MQGYDQAILPFPDREFAKSARNRARAVLSRDDSPRQVNTGQDLRL